MKFQDKKIEFTGVSNAVNGDSDFMVINPLPMIMVVHGYSLDIHWSNGMVGITLALNLE